MKRLHFFRRRYQLDVIAVMPIYNGYKYLHESIKSILVQRDRNLEVVIINDGSDQKTTSIVTAITNEFSDFLHPIQNESNMGATHALFQGFEFASQRNGVILTLAQDDLLPDFYVNSVTKTLARKRTVAVCTNLIPIGPNGEILSGILASPKTSFFGKYQTAWIFGLNLINAPGSLIGKGLCPEQYLQTNYPYTHDLHLWLHLSTLGRIRVSGKSNCFYRVHSESITANRNFEDFHLELTKNRRQFIASSTFMNYVKPLKRYQRYIFYAFVNLATSRESNCEHRTLWDREMRSKLGLKARKNLEIENCNLFKIGLATRGYSRKSKLIPRIAALNHISSLVALTRVVCTSSYFLIRKFLAGRS